MTCSGVRVGDAVEGLEVLSVIGPLHGRCRRLMLLALPLAFAVVAVPATPGAAEEADLPAAEVAEKLATIETIAGDVVAAGAKVKKATLIAEGISPVWHRIEDTIKANDKGSYEAFEAAIESLEEAAKAGDATKASGAAAALSSAADSYLAKFPAGSGTETAAAAAPEAEPAEGPAPGASRAAAEADATLARTGPLSASLPALAGTAFALGGLAVMAGARRPNPA